MFKIYFSKKKAPNFEQKWQKTGWTNLPRNLGKAWQQWLQCLQGWGDVGQLLVTTRIHPYSGTHAC